jgi:putative FmdB family regulatory protein
MPIFEYVCGDCGHRFETLVQGPAAPVCPACRGSQLAKQYSVFAVSTRGSAATSRPAGGPCGACGHPDGPGACSLN